MDESVICISAGGGGAGSGSREERVAELSRPEVSIFVPGARSEPTGKGCALESAEDLDIKAARAAASAALVGAVERPSPRSVAAWSWAGATRKASVQTIAA